MVARAQARNYTARFPKFNLEANPSLGCNTGKRTSLPFPLLRLLKLLVDFCTCLRASTDKHGFTSQGLLQLAFEHTVAP